jgi:uncharacterized membrane protein
MLDVILYPQRSRRAVAATAKGEKQGDRPLRSLFKTVSWRIVGTLDTITISYVITGEIRSALSIGGIEVFSKLILYYFHERLWAKVKRQDGEDRSGDVKG